jgi:peptidyl-dipeptidase A
MSTNLHEFGHAIYAAELDPGLPFILRDDAHLLANEAIALLMERHMVDPWWLAEIVGLPSDRAAEIASRGRRHLAIKHLVFTRWVLVMCHFERALYENPDNPDLASLWWDMVEEFQEVRRPEPRRGNHDWASKIHFVGYPAYYQNYLLGEVFGTQLERAVRRECGGLFGRPEAGERLAKGMFRRGATLPWRDLLHEVAGEDFSVQPFLEVVEQA